MAWLWYFAFGLAVFLARLPFRNRGRRTRLVSFLAGGICLSLIAAFFGAKTAASRFTMPSGMVVAVGAISALVLFMADEKKWAGRFWFRFFLTPVLGLIIALASTAVFAFLSLLTMARADRWPAVFFTFMLMGLLAAFGYTFPDRWFSEKR
jgi:hypothetical protein